MTAPVTILALAGHFAGDFLFQSDRMADRKFDDWRVRFDHCTVYTAMFLPVVPASGWSVATGSQFLVALFTTHFVVDSRRWVAPKEGFEAFPVWYDQALHIVSLGVAFALVEGVVA